jgi:hypothetical protein
VPRAVTCVRWVEEDADVAVHLACEALKMAQAVQQFSRDHKRPLATDLGHGISYLGRHGGRCSRTV